MCPLSPGKDKNATSSLLLPVCFEVFSLPTEKHAKPTMATKSIISVLVSLPDVQMSANLNTHTFLEPMHLVEVSQSPSELVQPIVGHIVSPVAKDDGGYVFC